MSGLNGQNAWAVYNANLIKGGSMMFGKVLIYICLSMGFCCVMLLCSCDGGSNGKFPHSAGSRGKQNNVFRITNGSSQEVKRLIIYYNGDSCELKDLKYGVPVRQQITASSPVNIRFVIWYADGQKIERELGSWHMAPDDDVQMVIEDSGKIVTR